MLCGKVIRLENYLPSPISSIQDMFDPLCSMDLKEHYMMIKIDWITLPKSLWTKTDISGMTQFFVKFYFLWDKISLKQTDTQNIGIIIRNWNYEELE